jgi:formylglycine-generating enzyme required for sulfatase activity
MGILAMAAGAATRSAGGPAQSTAASETSALRAGEGRTFSGVQFVWIPAGTFQMGSQASPEAIERRYGGEARFYGVEHSPHQVTLTRGFWLGCYPVLNGQFEVFVKATAYRTEAERQGWGLGYDKKIGHSNKLNGLTWQHPSYTIAPGQPVVMVSWNDAQAYIQWLNGKGEGSYRLPTEAEWEYACRAGTTTAFSFGDDASQLGKYAWFADNAGYTTHVAGQKRPNAWGLYDMHGNVWDWCQDWMGDYPSGAVVDPTGPSSGQDRIMRGGSWHSPAAYCRSANRRIYSPDTRNISLGFRLVRTATPYTYIRDRDLLEGRRVWSRRSQPILCGPALTSSHSSF